MNETGKQKGKLRYILGAMGPSMILTATYIGSGSVVSTTSAGANFGYSLLWWLAILCIINGVFQYYVNKYAIVTGQPVLIGIRKRFGAVWTTISSILCLITVLAFGVGNFMATGLAFNIIFPTMSVKIGGIVGTVIGIVLILLRGLYKKLEKGMNACILLMIVFLICTFVAVGGADWGKAAEGIVPSIPAGSWGLMLSLLGTTVSFGPMLYGSTFAVEKGYTKEDIKRKGLLADAVSGPIVYFIIMAIVLSLGATLFAGNAPASALQIGMGLQAALGGSVAIRVIFGIAFLGAALSSLVGAQVWGSGAFFQGLGKGSSMDFKGSKFLCAGALALCAIGGLIFSGIPVPALMAAQWAGIITTPLLGILLILLLRNKKEMGADRIPVGVMILLLALYALLIVMVVRNLIGLL